MFYVLIYRISTVIYSTTNLGKLRLPSLCIMAPCVFLFIFLLRRVPLLKYSGLQLHWVSLSSALPISHLLEVFRLHTDVFKRNIFFVLHLVVNWWDKNLRCVKIKDLQDMGFKEWIRRVLCNEIYLILNTLHWCNITLFLKVLIYKLQQTFTQFSPFICIVLYCIVLYCIERAVAAA